MISRYQVSLNGSDMSSINPNLLVLDVSYADPSYAIDSTQVGGRDGAVILNETKESASVTITFELHIYSIAERQMVCQLVNAWAKDGGILRINDRPDQRLHCKCSRFASVASAKNWTDPLTVVFSGFQPPYWQDEQATELELSGVEDTSLLDVPGNGKEAYVECTVVPQATLTHIILRAGESVFDLSGLSIPSGDTLSIGYQDGILHIRHGSTSLLGSRTGNSSDDLKVPCGQGSSFSVTADAAVEATFSVRGCWT